MSWAMSRTNSWKLMLIPSWLYGYTEVLAAETFLKITICSLHDVMYTALSCVKAINKRPCYCDYSNVLVSLHTQKALAAYVKISYQKPLHKLRLLLTS